MAATLANVSVAARHVNRMARSVVRIGGLTIESPASLLAGYLTKGLDVKTRRSPALFRASERVSRINSPTNSAASHYSGRPTRQPERPAGLRAPPPFEGPPMARAAPEDADEPDIRLSVNNLIGLCTLLLLIVVAREPFG